MTKVFLEVTYGPRAKAHVDDVLNKARGQLYVEDVAVKTSDIDWEAKYRDLEKDYQELELRYKGSQVDPKR